MTSWHKTGTHPFYIGMYIHIYTHIYVHKNTSQKECLHIFLGLAGLRYLIYMRNHTSRFKHLHPISSIYREPLKSIQGNVRMLCALCSVLFGIRLPPRRPTCHVSGVNLALNRPSLASSQRLSNEHVSRMVDGVIESQWASASTDAHPWAWVDLLSSYNVT